MSGVGTVRLLGLPIAEFVEAGEHSDALLREFTLISYASEAGEADSVPARVLRLVEEVTRRYAVAGDAVTTKVEAAVARGEAVIDVQLELPLGAADVAERLDAMLEEADAYCRAGELLTLETPPRALAFRRWYLGQVRDQLRQGAVPVSYSEFLTSGGSASLAARS